MSYLHKIVHHLAACIRLYTGTQLCPCLAHSTRVHTLKTHCHKNFSQLRRRQEDRISTKESTSPNHTVTANSIRHVVILQGSRKSGFEKQRKEEKKERTLWDQYAFLLKTACHLITFVVFGKINNSGKNAVEIHSLKCCFVLSFLRNERCEQSDQIRRYIIN